jgi:hypothetical protein
MLRASAHIAKGNPGTMRLVAGAVIKAVVGHAIHIEFVSLAQAC